MSEKAIYHTPYGYGTVDLAFGYMTVTGSGFDDDAVRAAIAMAVTSGIGALVGGVT
jgi:hypothetical protein